MIKGVLILLCVWIAGCQTTQPEFAVRRRAPVFIDGYKFTRLNSVDKVGSAWRLIEIKPEQLPYKGKIAAQSAEKRWLKLFNAALVAIKEDCGGPPRDNLQFRSAELDYAKLGDAPEHPAYIQARYMCR